MKQLNLFGTKTTRLDGCGQYVQFPPMTPIVSEYMMALYDNFNQKVFDETTTIIKPLYGLTKLTYDVFGQSQPKYNFVENEHLSLGKSEKDIILGFSGGLDSCYQALLLRNKGFNVHLFHVVGIHGYEGLSEMPAVESFAQKTNLDLITVKWKRNTQSKYKQQWGDNAVKNQFIEALMIDYCNEHGWNKVSIGEDNSYSVYRSDVMLGTNVTDCKEVQIEFENAIHSFVDNIEFHLIERPTNSTKHNKLERLKLLDENGLLDDYYSCVGAGRFNKHNHDLNENKYGISLNKHNCGCYCTKCALHNLVMHYGGMREFPKEFLDKCWARLNDVKFNNMVGLFGVDLPIEQRITNLLTY